MSEPRTTSRLAQGGVILAGLSLLLALISVVQVNSNRNLQKAFAEGQASIAKAQTLANLDNSLIQLVAKSAVENRDAELRNLLARNGVTFNASPPVTPNVAQTEAK